MAANSSNTVMIVNVRYNSTNSLPVEVDPKWNVGRLKEEISKIKNIPKSEVRIIFQGREIHDSLTIQHCDLGNNSVLHAVQARSEPLTLEAEIPTESLPQITTIPETYKSQFYVYCKDRCNAVKPGKIRVRCKKCQSGAFEVHRDPEGWDDVLEPNQITGVCLNKDHCDGNIAELYFKCKEHDTGEKDTSAVLNLVRPNRNQVPCITCYNESNPIMVWPCSDQHCMCLDCFKDYGTTKLQERGFLQNGHVGYTLPCPGPATDCNEAFVKEPHHFRVLGSEQYERYKNFATEEFVLQSGGVLCPSRDCGAPLMLEHTMRKIQCHCGHVFCRTCKEPFHDGDCTAAATAASVTETTYTVDPDRANRARYEQASRDEVKKIAIPCPKCQVPTERNGGCMHMTCSRCKFNWCWLCKTEWSRECQGSHWFGTRE